MVKIKKLIYLIAILIAIFATIAVITKINSANQNPNLTNTNYQDDNYISQQQEDTQRDQGLSYIFDHNAHHQ